jgi:hypothetical protein
MNLGYYIYRNEVVYVEEITDEQVFFYNVDVDVDDWEWRSTFEDNAEEY